MGRMPNTPKLKANIVHSIKVRDIENSSQKLGDFSSFDCCGGDSGVGGSHVKELEWRRRDWRHS